MGEREGETGGEKRMQEISGNSLGGKGTRQLEPKTKDWFSLFHRRRQAELKTKRIFRSYNPKLHSALICF